MRGLGAPALLAFDRGFGIVNGVFERPFPALVIGRLVERHSPRRLLGPLLGFRRDLR